MRLDELQTIILCGGLGTRLKNLYPDLPKALVPINGKPFIEWQISWLVSHGIRRIHLAAGYKADSIAGWLDKYKKQCDAKISITFSQEPEPLGTGGGLFYAVEKVSASAFLVLNGDTLLPSISLNQFVDFSNNLTFEIVIAIVEVKDGTRFGAIIYDSSNRLCGFAEKAKQGKAWINGGIYLFKRTSVDVNKFSQSFSIEKDLFPTLLKEGKIGVFPVEGELFDMGTPEGIREMERFLTSKHL